MGKLGNIGGIERESGVETRATIQRLDDRLNKDESVFSTVRRYNSTVLDNTSITVRIGSGPDVGTEPRLNFIGSGISITGTDDAVNSGVDLTFTVASVDESSVTYAPAVNANWNSGVDPGNVDDALDQLAANLGPLLPSSAPVLSSIDYDSTNGTSGINTWNAANPITGYSNSPSDSSFGANALDVTMSASGNLHGVYDYDTIVSVTGTLADTTTGTTAYPNYSFSPGGSDGDR